MSLTITRIYFNRMRLINNYIRILPCYAEIYYHLLKKNIIEMFLRR